MRFNSNGLANLLTLLACQTGFEKLGFWCNWRSAAESHHYSALAIHFSTATRVINCPPSLLCVIFLKLDHPKSPRIR